MGKPGGHHRPSPPPEHIGRREATRGTETSKYPEEEKSNEMPTVAASEEGRAQTRELRLFGVEDQHNQSQAQSNYLER